MALLNGKGSFLTGLLIGAGAALTVAALVPGIGEAARPRARSAIKAGLRAYEKGRVAMAEFGEMTEDMVAEAKADLASEQQATTAGPDVAAREEAAEART